MFPFHFLPSAACPWPPSALASPASLCIRSPPPPCRHRCTLYAFIWFASAHGQQAAATPPASGRPCPGCCLPTLVFIHHHPSSSSSSSSPSFFLSCFLSFLLCPQPNADGQRKSSPRPTCAVARRRPRPMHALPPAAMATPPVPAMAAAAAAHHAPREVEERAE